MEEDGSEPAVMEPGPATTSPGQTDVESTAPVESRTRKRVTFDLDLQVHTIPNRIPIYERRPAASTVYARPANHPLAFVPRPLDLKGKDRYLLGATTTKKIIDLFGLPNGYPSYPTPPASGSKRVRQGGSAQAVTNPNNPYYTFADFRTSKISRAAMNLKQITAALGEHFDSSVYKEWESSKRVQASMPSSPPPASRHGARSAGSIVSELGMPQTRRVGSGNAIAAFSQSRLRVAHHQGQSPKPNLSPTPPKGHHSVHGAYTDVQSSPMDSWDRQRLPLVTSEQISLYSRSHSPRKGSAASDSTLHHLRRGGSPADSSPVEGGPSEMLATVRDRPPSRCSTIETYIISDIPGAKPSPSAAGALSVNGPRSAGPASGHRRVVVSANARPVAWEAGIAIPITEPELNFSAIRTSPTVQDGGNMGHWQVTSRPPNLST